jgi:hypothetical protein
MWRGCRPRVRAVSLLPAFVLLPFSPIAYDCGHWYSYSPFSQFHLNAQQIKAVAQTQTQPRLPRECLTSKTFSAASYADSIYSV